MRLGSGLGIGVDWYNATSCFANVGQCSTKQSIFYLLKLHIAGGVEDGFWVGLWIWLVLGSGKVLGRGGGRGMCWVGVRVWVGVGVDGYDVTSFSPF